MRDKVLYGTNKRAARQLVSSQDRKKVGFKSVDILGEVITGGTLWDKDYAIIKLKEPIKLGPTAKKVELGTYSEFIQHVLVSFQ